MPHLVGDLLRVFDGIGDGLAEEFSIAPAQPVHCHPGRPFGHLQFLGRAAITLFLNLSGQETAQSCEESLLAGGFVLLLELAPHAGQQG